MVWLSRTWGGKSTYSEIYSIEPNTECGGRGLNKELGGQCRRTGKGVLQNNGLGAGKIGRR